MKNTIDQLAIFDGKPAFVEQLHVGSPIIGSREHLLALMNEILDKRWLTRTLRG